MRKIIFLLALITSCFLNAQKVEKVDKTEKEAFLANETVKKLMEHAKELGFKKDESFLKKVSKKVKGKDDTGEITISLIVYSFENDKKETLEVVQLFKTEKEKSIWSETDSNIYYFVKGKIVTIPQTKPKPSIDCYKKFKKGTADCKDGISCVNNCWNKTKKWERVSCALFECTDYCWTCLTDIYGFMRCVFG